MKNPAKPRVSLVVGVYNGERYLPEALESVRAQSFRDWECICVDDGSTDSSGRILADVSRADSRFRIVTQSNRGVGGARNAGLEQSSSEFVMFMDQDDMLRSEAMAVAVSAIERTGADVLRFQSNNHARSSPLVWERIFRRDAIDGVRFPEITGGEDTAFMWELGLLRLKCAEIGDELYWNRDNPDSASRRVSPRYVKNVFAGFRAMRASAARRGMPRLEREVRLLRQALEFSLSVCVRRFSPANALCAMRELSKFLLRWN